MSKIETFWCVRDPGPLSELRDICWKARGVKEFCFWAVGANSCQLTEYFDSITIYTDEEEAQADAVKRLAKRDAAAKDGA